MANEHMKKSPPRNPNQNELPTTHLLPRPKPTTLTPPAAEDTSQVAVSYKTRHFPHIKRSCGCVHTASYTWAFTVALPKMPQSEAPGCSQKDNACLHRLCSTRTIPLPALQRNKLPTTRRRGWERSRVAPGGKKPFQARHSPYDSECRQCSGEGGTVEMGDTPLDGHRRT